MAGASLLTLLDDIASVLDDVAILTKVAAKKTAGVLGDDLALNAQQVTGLRVDRELPVVWAVAKGSAVNKLILAPSALLISAFLPVLIMPLLMIGGAYLCFEGVEKLAHKLLHPKAEPASKPLHLEALSGAEVDLVALEREKVRGAIRTDFVLSAEIIVIALGTVAGRPLLEQALALAGVSVLMTVGVYGLVAGIVKLDDAGLHLSGRPGQGLFARAQRALGRALVGFSPLLLRFLAVAGTAAMFLVGGGILVHGLPPLHHLVERAAAAAGPFGFLASGLLHALVGIAAGTVALGAVAGLARVRRAVSEPTA